jgi:hypothetical protein
MKSLLVGIGTYLYKVYNCHDSRALWLQAAWDPLLPRWYGLDGNVMVLI